MPKISPASPPCPHRRRRAGPAPVITGPTAAGTIASSPGPAATPSKFNRSNDEPPFTSRDLVFEFFEAYLA